MEEAMVGIPSNPIDDATQKRSSQIIPVPSDDNTE